MAGYIAGCFTNIGSGIRVLVLFIAAGVYARAQPQDKGECEAGLPRLPAANVTGSGVGSIYIGQQYIAQGLIFNRSGSISAVHLVGTCPRNQSCFMEFQIWSLENLLTSPDPPDDWTLSVLHRFSITLSRISTTHFSTSVPITETVAAVEPGNVVGFSAPNTGGSIPVEISTTMTNNHDYTVFGFPLPNPGPSELTRQQASYTHARAVPLISVEFECTNIIDPSQHRASKVFIQATLDAPQTLSDSDSTSDVTLETTAVSTPSVAVTQFPLPSLITTAEETTVTVAAISSTPHSTMQPAVQNTTVTTVYLSMSVGDTAVPMTPSKTPPKAPLPVVIALVAVIVLLVTIGVVIVVAVTSVCVVKKKNKKHKLNRPLVVYESPQDNGYYNYTGDTALPGSNGCYEVPGPLTESKGGSLTTTNTVQAYEIPMVTVKDTHFSSNQLPVKTDQYTEVTDSSDHEYQQADEIAPEEVDVRLLTVSMLTDNSIETETFYGCVPTMDQRRKFTNTNDGHCISCSDTGNMSEQYKSPSAVLEGPYECESEAYWAPATKEEEIYAQMAKGGYQEIPRSTITLSEKLGEGQFGEVFKAEMRTVRGASLKVAVKLVKKGSPPEERTKLLQEAATLGQFKHRHVVRLIGVVTLQEPGMMLMELLTGGDLREHLDSLRSIPSELSSPDLPSLLLQFCKQVVDGLACLARKSFVHRDIAARNILLDKDLNCKISDFGMTRDLEDDDYYSLKQGSKIPLKWTAPETLFYKKYSTHSDIWSYGMLMYEIWSVGHKPFEDVHSSEMIKYFHNNYCHPPPPGCPRAVYEVMVKCWNYTPRDRPSAEDILGDFCRSERQLLSWKETDVVSSSSKTLGAPLSEGRELYRDLQCKYANT